MNIPLNIDWQQILLHWLNLAILIGGLYFLLYKPVKQFMEKRAAHYEEIEKQAAGKLEEASKIRETYQAKIDQAEAELREHRIKAQQAVQKSTQEQLDQAEAQAKQIIEQARAQAEHNRERMIKESQRELKKLATEAAEKIAFHADEDPFDQFLNLAEGGGAHDKV